MCVPPPPVGWWQPPGWSQFFLKVRGSSPRRGSSPLLTVPTPEGWKAEYTLASRMQIHETLTVLALLTSDPWICSLMLYHLSYLTTTYTYTYIYIYIHTYIYIHIYIHTYIYIYNVKSQILKYFPWNCWLMLFMSSLLALIYSVHGSKRI